MSIEWERVREWLADKALLIGAAASVVAGLVLAFAPVVW